MISFINEDNISDIEDVSNAYTSLNEPYRTKMLEMTKEFSKDSQALIFTSQKRENSINGIRFSIHATLFLC